MIVNLARSKAVFKFYGFLPVMLFFTTDDLTIFQKKRNKTSNWLCTLISIDEGWEFSSLKKLGDRTTAHHSFCNINSDYTPVVPSFVFVSFTTLPKLEMLPFSNSSSIWFFWLSRNLFLSMSRTRKLTAATHCLLGGRILQRCQ